jgi:hypothetical protein
MKQQGQRHDSVHELTQHVGGKTSAILARPLDGRHGRLHPLYWTRHGSIHKQATGKT